jgi:hypothetical protein
MTLRVGAAIPALQPHRRQQCSERVLGRGVETHTSWRAPALLQVLSTRCHRSCRILRGTHFAMSTYAMPEPQYVKESLMTSADLFNSVTASRREILRWQRCRSIRVSYAACRNSRKSGKPIQRTKGCPYYGDNDYEGRRRALL